MLDLLDAVILAAGLGGAYIVRDLFRALVLGLIVRGARAERAGEEEETTDAGRVRSALDDRVRAEVRRTRGGVTNG